MGIKILFTPIGNSLLGNAQKGFVNTARYKITQADLIGRATAYFGLILSKEQLSPEFIRPAS